MGGGCVNKGLIGSTYSLSKLSLPSTCSLTTMATRTSIVKVWTCKGMIFKHVPPFSGLTDLLITIGYTTNGVAGTLLLVLISTYTKLGGSYLKSRKAI